ncbi:unnamed protein product [Microthlaspi erraticum]|uniref:PORR domain-containing protein n=1 Tax=Microthlaspi erraticum TaxID=1685480 RepID=A0A6D2J668_9BRAS|nr:unnamed protein product [Microthlaspi erraticum]CAA7050778.1 unnamed protein product [Microthlaspi erraticum]
MPILPLHRKPSHNCLHDPSLSHNNLRTVYNTYTTFAYQCHQATVSALSTKLQKLLMLYRRLLLSKLVHIGPDFGSPPNFRSRLCNDYPDKFKIVDTSYGRAVDLVSWDHELAKQMPSPEVDRGLIVDRPLR